VPNSINISATGYKWKEIADLPADLEPLRDRELEALLEVWNVEKDRSDTEQVQAFNQRLAREWAIETGIIEDVYTLDRGTTQTLIERGIDSSYIPHNGTNRDPELVARTIQAHADALEGLLVVGQFEKIWFYPSLVLIAGEPQRAHCAGGVVRLDCHV
jgi:hypothetical protein